MRTWKTGPMVGAVALGAALGGLNGGLTGWWKLKGLMEKAEFSKSAIEKWSSFSVMKEYVILNLASLNSLLKKVAEVIFMYVALGVIMVILGGTLLVIGIIDAVKKMKSGESLFFGFLSFLNLLFGSSSVLGLGFVMIFIGLILLLGL